MKVITEEELKTLKRLGNYHPKVKDFLIFLIRDKCEEIDQLTVTNEPDLILAAEKYAEVYDGDERQDIKTDVLNAFYHGSAYQKRKNDTRA